MNSKYDKDAGSVSNLLASISGNQSSAEEAGRTSHHDAAISHGPGP
jgi:hypothetical protein